MIKDIVGFPNYKVDEYGNIHGPNGILKHNINPKHGYHYVRLSRADKTRKHCSVHRLVALAFIENPEEKPQVNHKDGDKGNNNSSNLEWNTRKENMEHAIRTGLHSPNQNAGKTGKENGMSKAIIQMDKDGNFIKKFDSANLAAKSIGGNVSKICMVARGKRATSSGFKWRYE